MDGESYIWLIAGTVENYLTYFDVFSGAIISEEFLGNDGTVRFTRKTQMHGVHLLVST